MTARNRLGEGPLKQDLREPCLRMDVSAVAEQHEAGECEEWGKKAAHECFGFRVSRHSGFDAEPVIGRASRGPGGIAPE
jgi:hypothetical protein